MAAWLLLKAGGWPLFHCVIIPDRGSSAVGSRLPPVQPRSSDSRQEQHQARAVKQASHSTPHSKRVGARAGVSTDATGMAGQHVSKAILSSVCCGERMVGRTQ